MENPNTFIRIIFPNNNFEKASECLQREFSSYKINILKTKDDTEYMLTGVTGANPIIRYRHDLSVVQTLKISPANTIVQEVRLIEKKKVEKNDKIEKTIGRIVIATPFGEITFEEISDLNKTTKTVYSELKQNKGPYGLLLINEFSRYLRDLGKDTKIRSLKK